MESSILFAVVKVPVPREPDQQAPWSERVEELVAALRRTEAGFREFIDRCPDAVYVRRGPTVVHANGALLELLGIERGEIEGRDPVALAHPDHRAEVLEHRSQSPDATDLREHRWIRKDGEVVFVDVVGVTVTFEGAPARVVMCRNVTERKKMQARLLVAEHMASIGTLAAGIAHEINNPLSSVVTNLQLIGEELRGRAGDPSEIPEMLADTLEGLARVRRIVAGLKTFALADGEQREHLELARVVDSAVELASSVIRGRARLVREDQAVVLVDANRGRLTQVVVNLLVNGAHAIPEGDAGGNELRVETRTDGAGRAVLSVRDTGVGIPPENLARIFDPFFTTRAVGAGTGLGLFIVHNVVAGLGGEISVESQMGVGTTFTVVLPAAPPP